MFSPTPWGALHSVHILAIRQKVEVIAESVSRFDDNCLGLPVQSPLAPKIDTEGKQAPSVTVHYNAHKISANTCGDSIRKHMTNG